MFNEDQGMLKEILCWVFGNNGKVSDNTLTRKLGKKTIELSKRKRLINRVRCCYMENRSRKVCF